jgi:hypothetical protein
VEELALEAELPGPSVDAVAGDREIDRGEVDANLMGAAGLESDVKQGVPRQQLRQLEVRDRVAWRVRVERVAHRVAAVAADGRLDAAAA